VQVPTWMHASGPFAFPSTTRTTTLFCPALCVLNDLVTAVGSGVFLRIKIWFCGRPVAGSVPMMPKLCEVMFVTEKRGAPAVAAV